MYGNYVNLFKVLLIFLKHWWCQQQRILCCYAWGRWSFGNNANWRRTTYRCWNPTYRNIYVNLKVLPISKVMKLYTTLSSSSTINCFASMFKRKLVIFMMNCDDRLRRFNETLTNWHSMSIVKNECAWHVQTMSMNPNFCEQYCTLNWDVYLNGCILKWEIIWSSTNIGFYSCVVIQSCVMIYSTLFQISHLRSSPKCTHDNVKWLIISK